MGAVRIVGESGPVVLLLPGGAEPADGFFPGQVDGLAQSCRVVLHDRPGTGRSTVDGALAGATAHLHALVGELGEPVVAVGQSLGGAVAVLLAREHPADLAGVVLLDPSPINDPASARRLERTSAAVSALARFGPTRRPVRAAFRAAARRELRGLRGLRPDCAAAFARTLDTDLPQLGRAVAGFAGLAAGLREADLPRLPSAVVTADRPAGTAMRRAHARLAEAFGGPLVSWPGATHSVHLDHPDEVLDTIRAVVGEAGR